MSASEMEYKQGEIGFPSMPTSFQKKSSLAIFVALETRWLISKASSYEYN